MDYAPRYHVFRFPDRPVSDDNVKCSQCSEPLFKHSRCWRHYVLRFAERRKFTKTLWWKAHEDQFLAMMKGKYMAQRAGLDGAGIDEFVYMFTHGKNRLTPTSQTTISLVRGMVSQIALQAKKEYYAGKATVTYTPDAD